MNMVIVSFDDECDSHRRALGQVYHHDCSAGLIQDIGMVGMANFGHQNIVVRVGVVPLGDVPKQGGKERAGHCQRPGSLTVDGPTVFKKNYGARRCRISSSSPVEVRNYGRGDDVLAGQPV